VPPLPAWWPALRSLLEALFFLGGIAVAIAASKALEQIRLAKEQLTIAADALRVTKTDIALRVRREALLLAAEQCDRFAEKIIPQAYEWQKAVDKAGGTRKRWPMNDQEFAWISLVDPKAAKMWTTIRRQPLTRRRSRFVMGWRRLRCISLKVRPTRRLHFHRRERKVAIV